MIMVNRKTAQSVLEYALLFSLVSAALLAMTTYIQRSMNAKLKVIQEELYESSR